MSYNRITLNIIPVQANNSSPCFMSKNTRQNACCSNVNAYSLWCYNNGLFFFCLYLWFSLCNRMRREPMWLTETQLTLVPSSTICGMANWFTTKSWPKKVFDVLWLCSNGFWMHEFICWADGNKDNIVPPYCLFLIVSQYFSFSFGSFCCCQALLGHIVEY